MENYKDFINSIEPYEYSQYQNVSSRDKLMAYAIYFLYKNNVPLTYSYIVVATYKLFPEIFTVDKEFPNFPDPGKLQLSYMHSKYKQKSKKPAIITGTPKTGFAITKYGISVGKETYSIITNTPLDEKVTYVNTDKSRTGGALDYNKFIESKLFKEFKETGEIDKNYIWLHFEVTPFTQIRKIQRTLDDIRKYAHSVNDEMCINCIDLVLMEI
jgi:hypothetical protein